MVEASCKPLLKTACRITKESDYAFVYDESTERVKVLNLTALHILKICDGKKSIKDITGIMHGLFPNIPLSKIEIDTEKFIEEAAKSGLVSL